MRSKKELRVNVGASSIILILLIFGLSAFAVLSIKASNNELKLAKKTSNSVSAYYEADTKAERLLAQIDEILNTEPLTDSATKLSDLKEVTDITTDELQYPTSLSYQVAMGDTAALSVTLNIHMNSDKTQGYDIQSWKMISTASEEGGQIELEDGVNLWDGQLPE